MKNCLSFILVVCICLFSFSCSEDELGDFQNNDPEPEVRLFTILDDYPALRSAFNSVDPYIFNELLCDAMNEIPGDVKTTLEAIDDLLINKKTDTLSSLRSILYRVINQDEMAPNTITIFRDTGYNVEEFPYYDMISEYIDPATGQKLNFTKPVLAMSRKFFGYLKYRFTAEELEDVMEDLIAHLRDEDANTMNVLFKIAGKLYLQANENIWTYENDPENKLDDALCSSGHVGKEGAYDTGLGNAVRGSDASFSGQEAVMKDPVYKEVYYEFIREAGRMMSSSVGKGGDEKDFSDILKELVCNTEKYFTEGGEIYESNDGNNDYHRGYIDEDGNIVPALNSRTGKEEYVNAEISNTIQELMVFLPSLFKRSDRPNSIAYNDMRKDNYYFITRWLDILRGIGFDPDKAHIEETLYDTIRFDVWGRDRLKDMDSYDLAKRPLAANFLQQLFFLICMGENYGWYDAYKEGAIPEENNGHGPLETSGFYTINDALGNLGFPEIPDPDSEFFSALGFPGLIDLYELALDGSDFDAKHTFRSSWEFNALDNSTKELCSGEVVPLEKEEYKKWSFRFDTDLNALALFPTQLAGDSGAPWGGNRIGGDGEKLNAYRPYCADGRGEPDIINVFLTMFVRSIWDGEGPYYSSEGVTIEEGRNGYPVYTYYRPDGRVYVQIEKPDIEKPLGDIVNPNDPYNRVEDAGDDVYPNQEEDDWKYFYPVAGGSDLEWEDDDPGFSERQRGQRKNCRYYDQIYTDYYMVHLDDIYLFAHGWCDMYVAPDSGDPRSFYIPARGAGVRKIVLPSDDDEHFEGSNREKIEKFEAGRVCLRELIPENCADRECETSTEALYRNLQFYCSEKKFALCIPFFMNISMEKIIEGMFEDFVPQAGYIRLLWDGFVEILRQNSIFNSAFLQSSFFFIGEGNGAYGMAHMRNVKASPEEMGDYYTTNGKWALKRDENDLIAGGQSYIPGDYRLNLVYECDDVFTIGAYIGNAIMTGLYQLDPLYFINAMSDLICDALAGKDITDSIASEGLAAFFLNNMIEGGAVLGGPLSTSMGGFVRMPFMRSRDPRDPEQSIEIFGSRKGELLKDRDENWSIVSDDIHSEWGFEANEKDPNWKNRNSFLVEGFIGFMVALRDAGAPFYPDKDTWEGSTGGGNFNKPNNDFNPSKGFLDTVMGSLASPMMYFQPGYDGSYPRMSWIARLINDHSIFYRTYDVPDTASPDSWEERNYYRPAELVNLLSIFSESDPFGHYNDEPKRCDGFLALLTEYDVTRPIGPDNPPNTRLITALFKTAMAFTDPKFDEQPAPYDESDYSTWSAREKIRYSNEQLLSAIKPEKADRMHINEKLLSKTELWPATFILSDWIFSDYGIRPEDIDLNDILGELIGSDETGKGLAIVPDSRPNSEDWKNFHLFFEAFGELLSDNGETGGRFNIMEDFIELTDLINIPNASDEQLKGLRHTMGVIFTRYNNRTEEWEYPGELLHVMISVIPDILEIFKGRYYSLCSLVEALMREDGFLEYFIYTLDSRHSGKEIFEQWHDFLGEDFIARHDSAFWIDLAELMTSFSSVISSDTRFDGDTWGMDDLYRPNDDVIKRVQPFEGMGDILSW